jgi:hypothetical protein
MMTGTYHSHVPLWLQLLTPIVEGILQADMDRFANLAKQEWSAQ